MTHPTRTHPTRKRAQDGLSLVEVTLIVSVVAIVLAASLPTFFRALRISKISEASRQIEQLQAHVEAYYATARTTSEGLRTSCLPDSAGPAPSAPSQTPVHVKLGAPDVPGAPGAPGAATWAGIGYEPGEPIRYRYSIVTDAPGCASTDKPASRSVVLRAEGDLDGDGMLSLFERTLRVVADELVPEPLFVTRDRIE